MPKRLPAESRVKLGLLLAPESPKESGGPSITVLRTGEMGVHWSPFLSQKGTSSVGAVFKVKNSAAHPETVLYNFAGSPDGANPYADVIFDASGNLYSTTSAGGANSAGTVFELLGPSLTSESVLYNFCPIAGCADGAIPYAGLMFDSVGNLYGTTYSGGTGCGGTCGTVFELIPSWTETVLYSFIGGGTDGSNPFAGVIYDPPAGSGVLYGVTRLSGSSSYGIAYSVP